MKLRTVLTLSFIAVMVPLSMLFYGLELAAQKKNLDALAREKSAHIEDTFLSLEERDTKILSSTLEVIVQDQAFKQVFLEKDREKLYDFGQPLFQNLKNKYGITHFYFILPDGHCLVRLHKGGQIFGDLITRFTLWGARDTKKLSSGIELGKTAFALRAVMPYYNEGELIGYVELGEEIDHFLEILKGESGDDYAILAKKDHLAREKWKSVRQVAGLEDNWDDLKTHVVLSATTEDPIAAECFTEENLGRIEEGEPLFQRINSGGRNFMCGGFSVTDAGGRQAGAVLSLMDITDQVALARSTNKAILVVMLLLISLATGVSIFISRSISRPLIELRSAAVEIAKGKLDKKVKVEGSDETVELADAFNIMAHKLQLSYSDLERQVEERTRDLKDAQEQLVRREKLAAVGQLASSIGHELRNPLGVIGNSSYYLNMKIKDADEKVKKHLDILQREVRRSNQIVTDLLDFSRASVPSQERVDMNFIVKDTLANMEVPENVTVESHLDGGLPEISADASQIRQVCQNIIANALQAMPEGGTLRIRTGAKDGYVEAAFTDTGEGIPEENIPKIFEPLYTTRASGIGLGLAIVKGIVDRHQGRIEAESEAGKGTTFSVSLPLEGEV